MIGKTEISNNSPSKSQKGININKSILVLHINEFNLVGTIDYNTIICIS